MLFLPKKTLIVFFEILRCEGVILRAGRHKAGNRIRRRAYSGERLPNGVEVGEKTLRTSENGTQRRNTFVLAVAVGSIGLIVASLRQGTGQTVQPQKTEFPALKPVVVIKRGQTSTVQWAWERHNGRAEQWYLLKDAATPDKDDVDYLRSQPKLDIDGVHIGGRQRAKQPFRRRTHEEWDITRKIRSPRTNL